MKRATLLFPDVATMAEFILTCKISKVEFDSSSCILSGELTDDLIAIGEAEFGGTVISYKVLPDAINGLKWRASK